MSLLQTTRATTEPLEKPIALPIRLWRKIQRQFQRRKGRTDATKTEKGGRERGETLSSSSTDETRSSVLKRRMKRTFSHNTPSAHRPKKDRKTPECYAGAGARGSGSRVAEAVALIREMNRQYAAIARLTFAGRRVLMKLNSWLLDAHDFLSSAMHARMLPCAHLPPFLSQTQVASVMNAMAAFEEKLDKIRQWAYDEMSVAVSKVLFLGYNN